MNQAIEQFLDQTGLPEQTLLLAVLAVGILIFVFGTARAFSGPRAEFVRMQRGARATNTTLEVVSRGDTDPRGIFKAFIPTSNDERSSMKLKLARAGIFAPHAVRNYYLVRTILGVLLPGAFIAFILMPEEMAVTLGLSELRTSFDTQKSFIILTVLVAIGFYGPSMWLRDRTQNRQKLLERGLPMTLDLLQISVEAGMGFDAAMNRVAHEMVPVCRPISEEFMTVQLEIQAGKEREKAFLNLADRCDVDEMTSFMNVILQAGQFGTSVSDALETYAQEMRVTRELKAQEQANKLPVKMSAVMAAMMMPVLLMITLTPVVIRMMRAFSDVF